MAKRVGGDKVESYCGATRSSRFMRAACKRARQSYRIIPPSLSFASADGV